MTDTPGFDGVSADYVLRTAQQNTLQLSAMADQKASVVLGACFVIASIVFGDITDADDRDVASVMLAITAVVSGILAALAVMPRVRTGDQRSRSHLNLLFFGSVAKLEHDDYIERMRAMISDRDALYDAVIEDLYQAAYVLSARKYPLLRASYVALTLGMVATLVAVLVT